MEGTKKGGIVHGDTDEDVTIKPSWVQWDCVGFASDSRVQNLPDEWKGYYFLLLNSLGIDGEIEWDEELLVQRFKGRSTDDRSTIVLIKKLLPLFESRVEDGRTFISHPKMDQARDHFFKYIEQKRIAGRRGGLVRQSDAQASSKRSSSDVKATSRRRSSDAQATLKRSSSDAQAPLERSSSAAKAPPKRIDLDLDPSFDNLEEKKDLEKKDKQDLENKDLLKPQERDLSEREKEKRREEELGLQWAESLGGGKRAVLVADTIEALQRTRSSGKMARGLMNRILFRLSQNEPTDVDDACRVFLKKHDGKSEKYLFGIIRSLKKEREGGKT